MAVRDLGASLALVVAVGGTVSSGANPVFAASQSKPLTIVFEGKGTRLGWDLGVMAAALDKYPEMASPETIMAGNSSGSIFASFFTCNGVSQESLNRAKVLLKNFDRSTVNDSENIKKFIQILMGKNTEYPHSNMNPVINQITNNGDCTPKQPMVIAALNAEILDNRLPRPVRPGNKLFQGRDIKHMTYDNYSVFLGRKYLGRACTYFVDPIMYDRLSQTPRNERLCDLRLVENADDMRVAILASISEPTYFPLVKEKNPEKLQVTEGQLTRTRYYGGGLVMPAVTQDIRRVSPESYLLGTGRNFPHPMMIKAVQAIYLVDVDRSMRLGKWWHDMEVVPPDSLWKDMAMGRFSNMQEFNLGKRYGQRCLQSNRCRPVGTIKPAFTKPVCIDGELCLADDELISRRGMP